MNSTALVRTLVLLGCSPRTKMAATKDHGFQVGFGQITDRVANWARPDGS